MGVSRFNVMLEPDLWDWAQKYGKDDQRSGSFIVNKALKEYRDKHEKKKPAAKKEVKKPEPAIGYLDCTNGQYPVTQADIDKWGVAYPAVDIGAELNKIQAWLHSNPTKRKTVNGCSRFINNWLSRTQNQGGSDGLQTANAGRYQAGQSADPVAGVNAAIERREQQRNNQWYEQNGLAMESGCRTLPHQMD